MADPTPRLTVITDWRVPDESALPNIAPGDECTRVITPQRFIVLHQIVVRGPSLVQLHIGAVSDVPFALVNVAGNVHRYSPHDLDKHSFDQRLVQVGARAIGKHAIAMVPALEVRLVLRNEGSAPTKPRVALVVQEEIT